MEQGIKNIVLDFGHGGLTDEGIYTTAPSKMHDFGHVVAYEGHLNRRIGGLLFEMLMNHRPDIKVITTVRSDDPRDLPLHNRVDVANKLPPDETIFVSIHCNAFNGNASGFELFTSRGETEADQLAETIADHIGELASDYGFDLRVDYTDGDADKEKNFYVLRKTKCPAVLVECLFFDNWDDFQKLSDIYFQASLASKLYEAIIEFCDVPNRLYM